MKCIKILLPGIFVWLCVSASFYVSGLIPILKNNFNTQALIVLIMIILYSITGAYFYYKNGSKINGLILGIVMSLTALVLDVFITVPYVEIPNGRSYKSFFSSSVLWILVSVNIITVYTFWKIKIKPKN
ncbi:DUF5367 family protein [Flavobacterium sp. HTF]|uniref:DUF5367 family protein n=1 Tax=Flavobacterium sp. HTF TaxID=2170732 RepID=UPI000D5EC9A8|nr:DUF5367 family protein [Flavobacterium sp. HTF]PWB26365.1 hypothetical protein DCO46_06045 [Flavobacterium sp. HTF]